jgi:hypothetical protein
MPSRRRHRGTPAVFVAGEVGAFLENDRPARPLSAKLDQPGKTAAANREVAPFTQMLRLAREVGWACRRCAERDSSIHPADASGPDCTQPHLGLTDVSILGQ